MQKQFTEFSVEDGEMSSLDTFLNLQACLTSSKKSLPPAIEIVDVSIMIFYNAS